MVQPPWKTQFVVSAGKVILCGERVGKVTFCAPLPSPRTRLAYTAFMRMSPKGISVAVSGVMLFRIRCWKGIIIRNGFILEEIHNMTAI